MGQCLGGGLLSLSLSLSRCSHLWHAFALNLKGFFTHFVVDFAHFIAISSQLIANFSYFIVVLIHLFACKRHFLGHCAFLKFLNALFLGFCVLFVILSVAKNPQRLKENLPFLDTSLALSMTNSGFCLKITGIFTQILKHKFKFFTQNSRHFVNLTHFITLSQNLSPTQGFFIFLPQIFYIFTQIAFKILKNSTQGVHYER